jgi:hypothetical protein
MKNRTKKAVALAAAVTSLGASLGVSTEESQAAVDKLKQQSVPDSAKQSTYIKKDNSKISSPGKISNQHKTQIGIEDKASHSIKWEYKK